MVNINKPLLTIGMPIYNGENYLSESIESILSQSFTNFKLIISDNASTDNTEDICRRFASYDNRIQYVRNQYNLGASQNFNELVKLSNTKYFKWAAADDICAMDLFEKCINVLNNDDSVVLAFGKVRNIDSNGELSDTILFDKLINVDDESIRFGYIINRLPSCMAVFGVFRTEVLKSTSLIANHVSSDKILLAQMSLRGKLHEISDTTFFRRLHSNTSCNDFQSEYSRSVWFDTNKKGTVVFPGWRLLYEYLLGVKRSRLNLIEKLKCNLHVLKWIYFNFGYLVKNIFVFILYILFNRPGFYSSQNRKQNVKTILINHLKTSLVKTN